MHLLDQSDDRLARICAHRGYSTAVPENTVASIKAAAAAGATFCEVDVRRCADGVFLLMHDRDVARTTDGVGLVSRLTWEELTRLDAGSWFSPAFIGERIPSLKECLDCACEAGLGLLLEIKDAHANEEWLLELTGMVRAARMLERCLFTSFDHTQLLGLKELVPEARTMGILHARVADVAAVARAARLDAVILEARFHHADDVRALRQAGLAVAYSVQAPESYLIATELGAHDQSDFDAALGSGQIDLVIGDDVDWLKSALSRAVLPRH